MTEDARLCWLAAAGCVVRVPPCCASLELRTFCESAFSVRTDDSCAFAFAYQTLQMIDSVLFRSFYLAVPIDRYWHILLILLTSAEVH